MDNVWKALTFLIAGIAVWVALQQWWISSERLRLDLFDRRHAVFVAIREFITSILRDARVASDAQYKFWADTANTGFLFHSDVKDYVHTVHEKSIKLQIARLTRTQTVRQRVHTSNPRLSCFCGSTINSVTT